MSDLAILGCPRSQLGARVGDRRGWSHSSRRVPELSDTSPEVRERMLEIYARMTPREKFRRVLELTELRGKRGTKSRK